MCQCTDLLSATQNPQGLLRVSETSGNQTHVTLLNVAHLCHKVMSLYWSIEKNSIWLIIFCNLELIFCMQDCLWFLKLNIKAKQDIPEFLTANLWLTPIIALDIDYSFKKILHTILLNFIEQLINLRKVRTENLKIGSSYGQLASRWLFSLADC